MSVKTGGFPLPSLITRWLPHVWWNLQAKYLHGLAWKMRQGASHPEKMQHLHWECDDEELWIWAYHMSTNLIWIQVPSEKAKPIDESSALFPLQPQLVDFQQKPCPFLKLVLFENRMMLFCVRFCMSSPTKPCSFGAWDLIFFRTKKTCSLQSHNFQPRNTCLDVPSFQWRKATARGHNIFFTQIWTNVDLL